VEGETEESMATVSTRPSPNREIQGGEEEAPVTEGRETSVVFGGRKGRRRGNWTITEVTKQGLIIERKRI